MIKGVLNFRMFIGISSYPYEFFVLSDLIILLISLVVPYFQLLLENVLLKLVIKYLEWSTLPLKLSLSFMIFLITVSARNNYWKCWQLPWIIRYGVIKFKDLILFCQLFPISFFIIFHVVLVLFLDWNINSL